MEKRAGRELIGEYGLQSRILRKLTRMHGVRDKDGVKMSPIRQSVLSNIMHGRRRATPEQAVMLEEVFHELGYAISKFDMVFAYKPGRSILELDKTKENA